MIVVDENFVHDQRELLKTWGIPFRHIGPDVGRTGMDDDEIVPLLIRLRRPTFFTRDRGWYDRGLLHAHYSVFVLEVALPQAASYVRRVLRHPHFDTEAKRLGKVVRASFGGLTGWTLDSKKEAHWSWL